MRPTEFAEGGRSGVTAGPPPQTASRWRRGALGAAGLMLVGLAGVGVVVPGLPSTPFVLAAAGCFAKSSPRLFHWLLGHQVFGPLVRDWHRERAIARQSKLVATVGIAGIGGSSLVVLPLAAKTLVGTILVVALWWIWSRREPQISLVSIGPARSGTPAAPSVHQ